MAHKMGSRSRSYDSAETFQSDFGGYMTDPLIHGNVSMGERSMRGLPQGMGDMFSDLWMQNIKPSLISTGVSAGSGLVNQFLQTETGQVVQQELVQQAQESAFDAGVRQTKATVQNAVSWAKANPGKIALMIAVPTVITGLVVYYAGKGIRSSKKVTA